MWTDGRSPRRSGGAAAATRFARGDLGAAREGGAGMAPFATWRLRSAGEQGRVVVAAVAAVLAALTLVLLLVRPDGPAARNAALPASTDAAPTLADTPSKVGVRATAGQPTHTAAR